MKRAPQIETGFQLLTRLSKRPTIEGLEDRLFEGGPRVQETIEISGNLSSGKTLLLTQLVAKCILPVEYDGISIEGRGIAVLLINTDHHFRVSKLVQLMRETVKQACKRQNILCSDTKIRELVIIPSIENLKVVNCYDNLQFKVTLRIIDTILMNDPRIGLVALDSVSSFYWQDREIGGVWLINQYLRNILKIIQGYIFRYNIVMVYTRSDNFASKTGNPIELAAEPTLEKINYRINLGDGLCAVDTVEKKTEITFRIESNGIKWIMQK